jgi:hypothetical protein
MGWERRKENFKYTFIIQRSALMNMLTNDHEKEGDRKNSWIDHNFFPTGEAIPEIFLRLAEESTSR